MGIIYGDQIERVKKQLEPFINGVGQTRQISLLIQQKIDTQKDAEGGITLDSKTLLTELGYHASALPAVCYAMLTMVKSGDLLISGITDNSLNKDGLLKIRYNRGETKNTVHASAPKKEPELSAAQLNQAGDRYLKGDGVAKDPVRAFECYRKAAAMNDAEGLYNLAWCYQEGSGTEKSVRYAKHYLLQAAEKGFIKAYTQLGFLLFFNAGANDDPDLPDSFRYMKIAADAGDADAQAHVAQAYQEDGWGAPVKDYELSKLYLLKAVKQGNEHAMWVLADNCFYGNGGWKEDHKMSAEYYRKAAEAGSLKAMRDWSIVLFFGDEPVVNSDPKTARYWAEKAFAQGDPDVDVKGWRGMIMVRDALDKMNGKHFNADRYVKGKMMVEEDLKATGDKRDRVFLEKLAFLEKYEFAPSQHRVDHIIRIAYQDYDTCLTMDADPKELLAEIEYPYTVDRALHNDCHACNDLADLFMEGKFLEIPYPLTNIISLELGVKWSRIAYQTKEIPGIENYIINLGTSAYTAMKVGAYDESIRDHHTVLNLLKEINSIPGYEGYFSEPEQKCLYHNRLADAYYAKGEYHLAFVYYMASLQIRENPDAHYGCGKALLQIQGPEECIKEVQEAVKLTNWMSVENHAGAAYFMAVAYRTGLGVPVNITTSYNWMKQAADLGDEVAKKELSRYKSGLFGYTYSES